VPDFEADDVIATLVERAPKDALISIVSTDKDLMQLVSDRVTLLDGVKDRRYGPSEVEERFGVQPDRILDLRALVGDPSDNIPGVKGIGEKGAAKLITEWGSLENLIEHRAEVAATRARNALDSQLEEARLSKRLATLRTDAPVPFVRLIEAIDAEGDVAVSRRPETPVTVRRVEDAASLDAVLAELRALPVIPLIGVLGENAPMSGDVVGLAFAIDGDCAAYLAIGAGSGELSMGFVADRLRPLSRAPTRAPGAPATPSRSRSFSESVGSSFRRPRSISKSRASCSTPPARIRPLRSRSANSAATWRAGRIWRAAAPKPCRSANSPPKRSRSGRPDRPVRWVRSTRYWWNAWSATGSRPSAIRSNCR